MESENTGPLEIRKIIFKTITLEVQRPLKE